MLLSLIAIFFINMNDQYIFSVAVIHKFYDELNKLSIYHSFNKYMHVDRNILWPRFI